MKYYLPAIFWIYLSLCYSKQKRSILGHKLKFGFEKQQQKQWLLHLFRKLSFYIGFHALHGLRAIIRSVFLNRFDLLNVRNVLETKISHKQCCQA